MIVASQPPPTDSAKSGTGVGNVGASSSTTGTFISIAGDAFPHSSMTLYCSLKVVAQPPLKLKSLGSLTAPLPGPPS